MIQLCYDAQFEIMIGLSSGLESVQLLMITLMKFLSMLPRKSLKRSDDGKTLPRYCNLFTVCKKSLLQKKNSHAFFQGYDPAELPGDEVHFSQVRALISVN